LNANGCFRSMLCQRSWLATRAWCAPQIMFRWLHTGPAFCALCNRVAARMLLLCSPCSQSRVCGEQSSRDSCGVGCGIPTAATAVCCAGHCGRPPEPGAPSKPCILRRHTGLKFCAVTARCRFMVDVDLKPKHRCCESWCARAYSMPWRC
jgi:hypothetical protein